jgi:hypothetical protein
MWHKNWTKKIKEFYNITKNSLVSYSLVYKSLTGHNLVCSRLDSSIGRVLDCESGEHGLDSWMVQCHSILWSFALYPCSSMYRRNQFLVKVKTTSTDKLFDSQPRKDAVAELCFGKFNVAYCHDPKWKLPIPPPPLIMIVLFMFCWSCTHVSYKSVQQSL